MAEPSFRLRFSAQGVLYFGLAMPGDGAFLARSDGGDRLRVMLVSWSPYRSTHDAVDRRLLSVVDMGQAATRVLLAALDGESLGDGLYGYDVYRRFGISMACLAVLGNCFSNCLGGLASPPKIFATNIDAGSPISLFISIWHRSAVFRARPAHRIERVHRSAGAGAWLAEVRRDLHAVCDRAGRRGNGIKLLLAVLVIEVITASADCSLAQDVFHRSAADRSFAARHLAHHHIRAASRPSWCFSGSACSGRR